MPLKRFRDLEPHRRSIARGFVLTALGWLAVVLFTVPFWGTYLYWTSFYHPVLLATVHVLTVGVLSQILIGLWYGIVRGGEGVAPPSTVRLWFQYGGLNASLIWFVLTMARGWHRWHLTLAATALGWVVMDVGLSNTVTLLRTKSRGTARALFLTAFVSLSAMGLLGFTLAHNKWLRFLGDSNLLHWIETHVLIGVGGWIGMMLLGFTVHFLPVPHQDPNTVYVRAAHVLTVGGFLLWIGFLWLGVPGLVLLGKALILTGMCSWLLELFRVWYRGRDNPRASVYLWMGTGWTYGIAGLISTIVSEDLAYQFTGAALGLLAALSLELGFLQTGLPRLKPFACRIPRVPLKTDHSRALLFGRSVGWGEAFGLLCHLGILAVLFHLLVSPSVALPSSWWLVSVGGTLVVLGLISDCTRP